MGERGRSIAFMRSCNDYLRATNLSSAAMTAIRRAVSPEVRVLDICGRSATGGLLALQLGARRVTALSSQDLSLARVHAQENGLDARMTFIESEPTAAALAALEGQFDVVLGLTLVEHGTLDQDYGARLRALAGRFGTPDVAVLPNAVRYSAQLVESADVTSLEADLAARKLDLESRYGMAFDRVLERLEDSRASSGPIGTEALRALGACSTFMTCYPGEPRSDAAEQPPEVALTSARDGRADGVLWTQELIHDGIVIKRARGCSWLDPRRELAAGASIAVPVADMARAFPFDRDASVAPLAQMRPAPRAFAPTVFWLTGISGAGKTTIATRFKALSEEAGWPTALLDGDALRGGLNAGLGFSEADRAENVRRIAEVAALMADTGQIVLVSCISPKRSFRETARMIVGPDRFVEVYVDTPLPVAEARDPKGLYRRARAGLIGSFTGISSDYEAPTNPQIRIDTTACDVEGAAQMLRRHYLEKCLREERASVIELEV
jgi:adenylylsulfate kinase